jgi:hypothetical protein
MDQLENMLGWVPPTSLSAAGFWVFKDDVTDVYFLPKAIHYSVLKTLDYFLLLDHRASGSLQFRDDWLLAVLLTLLSFCEYAKQILTH